jgi:hypothetical protein
MKYVLLIVASLAAGPQIALAQDVACHTIRRGDTVAEVARRLTGDPESRRAPWFQILDPVASRFVAKAQYDYVQPGWRACIIGGDGSAPGGSAPASAVSRATRAIDVSLALWALLVAAIAVAGGMATKHLQHRKAVVQGMRIFGDRFVSEFERSLIHRDRGKPPIQSRFRFHPSRGQLEVLIAPGAGRRYPNLLDHRQNVVYDVGRILQTLADQPFTIGSLHAHGRWVVVPFTLKSLEPR